MALDLDAIKARLSMVDGPWEHYTNEIYDSQFIVESSSRRVIVADDGMREFYADFIANAPEDIKNLIAEVERLRGEVD